MDERTFDRIRRRYDGDLASRWERIETAGPRGYLERNVALGRARLRDASLEMLGPLERTRVLDGGCGLGALTRRLAGGGAAATGVDLVGRFVEAARGATTAGDVPAAAAKGSAEFVEGNLLDLLAPGGGGAAPYDAVLLIEVLEDYEADERRVLLGRVAASGVPRICLGFSAADPDGDGLWGALSGADPARIDAVELLRWIHTHTLYRQIRRQVIKIRNYRAELCDLSRDG